jgi:hypothetical protein
MGHTGLKSNAQLHKEAAASREVHFVSKSRDKLDVQIHYSPPLATYLALSFHLNLLSLARRGAFPLDSTLVGGK